MAFPTTPLDLRCEVDLAGVWTDVSHYVMQRTGDSPPVSLQRGRQDESSRANPGAAAWEWNNRDGRFSPKNPLSPYYGQLGRNTPVRWSVPAQSNYLRLEYDQVSSASCPDAAGLHITGDIDIRLDVKITGWAASILASKWGTPQNCWLLQLSSTGQVQFFWSTTGSDFPSATSSVPLPVLGRQAIRVTLAVATGTVTFYTGPSGGADGSTWTQLGTAFVTGATSIFAGTAAIGAGNYTVNPGPGVNGNVYELEARSGIAGTVVAHPVFSAQTAGVTSFADAQSNTWTLNGTAELSARDYRWHGQMSAQPPVWDVTGTDQTVKATAGGLLRLISQGLAPLMSPIKRGYLLLPSSQQLVAYWPAEDSAGATSFGSADGGQVMYWSGSPTLSSSSSFIASAALPVVNGATFTGQVPAYTGGTACVFRFLITEGAGSITNNAVIARMQTTGTVAWCDLIYGTGGGLTLKGFAADGTVLFTLGPITFTGGLDGNLWLIEMVLNTSGANVAYAINGMMQGATVQSGSSGTLTSAVTGNVTSVTIAPGGGLGQVTMGHFAVQSFYNSTQLQTFAQPLNANIGETAAVRFARLASENGYQSRIIGFPSVSAAMGAQAIDTLANLLQACEDADQGLVFETRQTLALGYRTLASMYSQSPAVTLDYSQAQTGGVNSGAGSGGLEPTYDDLRSRNDWTLTRSAGTGASGATYQYQRNDGSAVSISPPPTGWGDYSDTLSVNVQYDSQLPSLASWKVHLGTIDEARWPLIPVNLARTAIQSASLYYPVLAADVGDFIEVVNAPQVVTYDPVKQIVYGTTESLGGFHHTVEWNAVPESPYEVLIAGSGHIDTDGTTLAIAATSGATSLTVATAQGFPVWTQNAPDWPFDVMIAGERITVTAVAAAANVLQGADANFSGPSQGHWTGNGGAFGSLAAVSSPARSAGGSLQVTANGTGGSEAVKSASLAQYATFGVPCVPGDSIFTGIFAQAAVTGRTIQVGPLFFDAFGNGLGSGAVYNGGVADVVGTWTQTSGTQTAPGGAAWAIMSVQVVSAAASEVHYLDDATLLNLTNPNPQVFTVTRAVNGVVKAQAAGASVNIYPPVVIGL